jgi:hypothetical protein
MRVDSRISCCLPFLVLVYRKTDTDREKSNDRHRGSIVILGSHCNGGSAVFQVNKVPRLSETRYITRRGRMANSMSF